MIDGLENKLQVKNVRAINNKIKMYNYYNKVNKIIIYRMLFFYLKYYFEKYI